MAVQPNLLPSYSGGMKAERAVKRITFARTEVNPGEMLYVSVPKLNENKVLMPGSLALIFDINLTGGHTNNYLVQNVSRALVDRMVVKFAGTTLQDTPNYTIFKIFEDLFLPNEDRDNMIQEGIQSVNLSKMGVNAENGLETIFKKS